MLQNAYCNIAGGPPKCIANVTSPSAPYDVVSLLCQVDIYGDTKMKANLIQNGQTVVGQTGNTSTVAWTTQAYNLISNVTCVVAFGFSSSCPTIQGMHPFLCRRQIGKSRGPFSTKRVSGIQKLYFITCSVSSSSSRTQPNTKACESKANRCKDNWRCRC
jgi:hypothetical protein